MKKVISLLLVFAMLCTLFAACADNSEILENNAETAASVPEVEESEPTMEETQRAYSETTASDFKYTHTDDGVAIEGYIGSDEVVVIPAEIDGAPVTSIGGEAFSSCSSLTSLTIPDGVTSIGENAFRECTALEDVVIPDSVTSIGFGAFYNTAIYNTEERWTDGVLYIDNWLLEAKESVSGDYVVASGTTGIADGAFGCSSLTSVIIPEGVTSISDQAFNNCGSLTEISVAVDNTVYTSENGVLFDKAKTALLVYPAGKTEAEYVIPESVTSIGHSAFSCCCNLTSLTIPESVTSIGWSAFYNCSALTSVTIPDSVTSIGPSAFDVCNSLTSVTIGNGVTSIGDYVFCECRGLTSVTIGNGVTSIGDYAFLNCSSLADVAIPDSVTSIGGWAFYNCSALANVTIPDSVTSIGGGAFYNTAIYNTAERWTDGVLYIDNWLIEAKNTVSGDYVVASGTTGIADGAFYDCQCLMSLTISDGVTSLGRETVICSSLAEINVAEDNTVYASENGVLFDKAKTALLVYPAGKTEAEYVIPESVTSIGEGAFWCSSNLRNVTIPDSVTSIGDSAFECSGLTSVTIGNGVTSIGNNVFEGCSSLTSVTIGNGVTSIGDLAFWNCDNLQEAYFMGNAPSLGVDAFMTWSIETQANIIIPCLTIYYLEGKDGWESPAWKDYPTSTWQK